MENKNIKDTFESFSPSEERKVKIYKSIINRENYKDKRITLHFKVKLAYALVACSILAAAATILITNNPISNNNVSLLEPENTQYNQVNIPSENSSLPAASDKKAIFKGFVLTAYAANGEASNLGANYTKEAEKMALTPDVKVLLAKYAPDMSSVPGLPFTVDISGDYKDYHYVEAIYVSVESGGLNRWNRDTGVVSSAGQSTTIDKGETIYWSPIYSEDDASIKNITITIEAVAGNTVIGKQNIYLTQDEQYYYYATVGELELV